MLRRVNIENYRGFQSYRMEGLTTVNLLVGRNNSGKTALLEAVHFLASDGDPAVLLAAASRREEVASGGREERLLPDVSHFFHGHDIAPGSRFTLASDQDVPPVTVEAVPLGDLDSDAELFEDARAVSSAFALKIQGGRHGARAEPAVLLSEEGALLVDPRRLPWRYPGKERRNGPPAAFIAPDSIGPVSLGTMWNHVLRGKQEGKVREAMRILEPDLEDIVLQAGEPMYRSYAGGSGVLVSFRGHQRRVPLGSTGDGMRRLLALSVSLIHARNGYLMIDEIDTGLHYSIMAKMWELVVRTARQSNIQVFATTHSADCVRGLGVLCKGSPDLREDVSVHKIERELDSNVRFSGAEVLDAVEQEIEIR